MRLYSTTSYYICPRCNVTMEREFIAYCDRCGQCLNWKNYRGLFVLTGTFNGNTYEWQAGRQLKRIDMHTLVGQDGVDATDGIDDASGTVICITFSKEKLHK